MKLENKVAIITGGSRGFGRATALAFVREGAKVVLASPEQDAAELDAVVAEVKAAGGEAIAVVTDVSKKSDVQNMADKAYETFGKVDILINSAGIGIHALIADIKEDVWDATMDVNLKGVFLCTQAVMKNMCDQGSGHIINIASTAGKQAAGKFGAYTASKWAVNGLTGVTDQEGFEHGVKATTIAPGAANTQIRWQNHDDDPATLLQPEDIAESILFVVSQPDRVYIPEMMVLPQFLKKPTYVANVKDHI